MSLWSIVNSEWHPAVKNCLLTIDHSQFNTYNLLPAIDPFPTFVDDKGNSVASKLIRERFD